MSRRNEDVAMADMAVELGGAEFGDARLSVRQLSLAARLAAAPGR
jgi:Transposase DNA-binding